RRYRNFASARPKDPGRHYLPDTSGSQLRLRTSLKRNRTGTIDAPTKARSYGVQRRSWDNSAAGGDGQRLSRDHGTYGAAGQCQLAELEPVRLGGNRDQFIESAEPDDEFEL